MNTRILVLTFFCLFSLGLQAQDQLSLCLKDANGEVIKQVLVETGGSTSITLLQDDDCHIFEVSNEVGNITLRPSKDLNYTNGVDVFDLYLMAGHILNVTPFSSDIQIYASDVNKSGTISSFDLVELNKNILGLSNVVNNKPSWTFWDVDAASFQFSNILSSGLELETPLAVTEVEMLGIKTGDVNFDADPDQLMGGGVDIRSDSCFAIVLKDQAVTAGNSYLASFVTRDFEDIVGVQFSLSFDEDALTYEDFIKSTEQELHRVTYNDERFAEGLMSNTWYSFSPAISFDDETVFMQVQFTALEDGMLSDFIDITSDFISAKAYNPQGEILNVCLEVDDAIVSTTEIKDQTFNSFLNIPNPFTEVTTIQFDLTESNVVQLDVFDLLGRVVQPVFSGDLAAGSHQFEVSNLSESGLYFYRLQIGDQVVTKQMVCVK